MYLNFTRRNNSFHYTVDNVTLGVIGIEKIQKIKNQKSIFLNQVHGKEIILIDRQTLLSEKWSTTSYDGAMSPLTNVSLNIKTADCIPVFFWQRSSLLKNKHEPYIAALHCGWRSIAKGILKEIVILSHQLQIPLKTWNICLGAGIKPANYQVGEDVLTSFLAMIIKMKKTKEDFFKLTTSTNNRSFKKKYHFDLKKIIKAQLIYFGFSADVIYDFDLCTYDEDCFYSHRQNQSQGRNINFIYRQPS